MPTRFDSRRRSLLQAGVAGGALLAAPSLVLSQNRSLSVGVYGGYFERSFNEHIFPEFTKATGIAVETVGTPTGEAWLVQLQQAARANRAPADVSIMAFTQQLRGAEAGLWASLDLSKMPNTQNVQERFFSQREGNAARGVGALSWYITLVTNTNTYPEAPESWAWMWDEAQRNRLGLLSLASNSFLLEVTAKTFLGGTQALDTEEGQLAALNKLAELKPNVRLWYRDEAQFEQALKTGEIPAGQYYHDVTGLAAAEGHPVRSTFPKEGGILDGGSWVVSRASQKLDEAHVFIDYMSQPAIQAVLARKVGTAPVVARSSTDLTDEEFSAVSSEIDPVVPRYDLYLSRGDWLNQKWTEMIVA